MKVVKGGDSDESHPNPSGTRPRAPGGLECLVSQFTLRPLRPPLSSLPAPSSHPVLPALLSLPSPTLESSSNRSAVLHVSCSKRI